MFQNRPYSMKLTGSLRCGSGAVLRTAAERGIGGAAAFEYYVSKSIEEGS